jgi:hypothetical protein
MIDASVYSGSFAAGSYDSDIASDDSSLSSISGTKIGSTRSSVTLPSPFTDYASGLLQNLESQFDFFTNEIVSGNGSNAKKESAGSKIYKHKAVVKKTNSASRQYDRYQRHSPLRRRPVLPDVLPRGLIVSTPGEGRNDEDDTEPTTTGRQGPSPTSSTHPKRMKRGNGSTVKGVSSVTKRKDVKLRGSNSQYVTASRAKVISSKAAFSLIREGQAEDLGKVSTAQMAKRENIKKGLSNGNSKIKVVKRIDSYNHHPQGRNIMRQTSSKRVVSPTREHKTAKRSSPSSRRSSSPQKREAGRRSSSPKKRKDGKLSPIREEEEKGIKNPHRISTLQKKSKPAPKDKAARRRSPSPQKREAGKRSSSPKKRKDGKVSPKESKLAKQKAARMSSPSRCSSPLQERKAGKRSSSPEKRIDGKVEREGGTQMPSSKRQGQTHYVKDLLKTPTSEFIAWDSGQRVSPNAEIIEEIPSSSSLLSERIRSEVGSLYITPRSDSMRNCELKISQSSFESNVPTSRSERPVALPTKTSSNNDAPTVFLRPASEIKANAEARQDNGTFMMVRGEPSRRASLTLKGERPIVKVNDMRMISPGVFTIRDTPSYPTATLSSGMIPKVFGPVQDKKYRPDYSSAQLQLAAVPDSDESELCAQSPGDIVDEPDSDGKSADSEEESIRTKEYALCKTNENKVTSYLDEFKFHSVTSLSNLGRGIEHSIKTFTDEIDCCADVSPLRQDEYSLCQDESTDDLSYHEVEKFEPPADSTEQYQIEEIKKETQEFIYDLENQEQMDEQEHTDENGNPPPINGNLEDAPEAIKSGHEKEKPEQTQGTDNVVLGKPPLMDGRKGFSDVKLSKKSKEKTSKRLMRFAFKLLGKRKSTRDSQTGRPEEQEQSDLGQYIDSSFNDSEANHGRIVNSDSRDGTQSAESGDLSKEFELEFPDPSDESRQAIEYRSKIHPAPNDPMLIDPVDSMTSCDEAGDGVTGSTGKKLTLQSLPQTKLPSKEEHINAKQLKLQFSDPSNESGQEIDCPPNDQMLPPSVASMTSCDEAEHINFKQFTLQFPDLTDESGQEVEYCSMIHPAPNDLMLPASVDSMTSCDESEDGATESVGKKLSLQSLPQTKELPSKEEHINFEQFKLQFPDPSDDSGQDIECRSKIHTAPNDLILPPSVASMTSCDEAGDGVTESMRRKRSLQSLPETKELPSKEEHINFPDPSDGSGQDIEYRSKIHTAPNDLILPPSVASMTSCDEAGDGVTESMERKRSLQSLPELKELQSKEEHINFGQFKLQFPDPSDESRQESEYCSMIHPAPNDPMLPASVDAMTSCDEAGDGVTESMGKKLTLQSLPQTKELPEEHSNFKQFELHFHDLNDESGQEIEYCSKIPPAPNDLMLPASVESMTSSDESEDSVTESMEEKHESEDSVTESMEEKHESEDGVTESMEEKLSLPTLPIPKEKKEKSSKRHRIASKLFGRYRQDRKDRCCYCKDNKGVLARLTALGETYAKSVAVQSTSDKEIEEEVECLKARIYFHRGHHNCDDDCNCTEKQGCCDCGETKPNT